MTRERLFGLMKLSLAHHPLCWQYRNHTLKIFNTKFCLGCTGFYLGFFFGSVIIFLSSIFSNYSWSELVLLSTVLYLPTIFRIIKLPLFNSNNKKLRFVFRFSLGFGITTGILSIFKTRDLIIQIIQITLGISLYIGLTIQRVLDKDAYKECETCSFTRSSSCLLIESRVASP